MSEHDTIRRLFLVADPQVRFFDTNSIYQHGVLLKQMRASGCESEDASKKHFAQDKTEFVTDPE